MDCPQTIPPMRSDSTGHLNVSVNILGSTSLNSFGISVHWTDLRVNATTADLTNTLLSDTVVSASCFNGVGLGCSSHDGPGVATLDATGLNLTAPVSGQLFKLSMFGVPDVDPHIGFTTGCSTVSVGSVSTLGSVPNSNLCLVVGNVLPNFCNCTQTFTSVPEGIQSQSLGTHLPTPLSPGGNITGTLSAGGAPNFADTFVMPYAVTLPGNITSWKAQFIGQNTPVGMQVKILRENPNSTSPILTVVEAGPVHNPTPVLFTRIPGYPFVRTELTVIPIYTDSLLTVLPGDFIGLTIIADSNLTSFDYPLVNIPGTRFVTSNVPVNGTIDLSDTFTGTLNGTAPALEVTIQPNPAALDTAGDGIPDFVALSPEMRAMGVDPCRKTVLVQIDYMISPDGMFTFRPLQQALDNVTHAFDSAPAPAVTSCPYQGYPIKSSGVNLIFDVRNVVPYQTVLNFSGSQPQSFDTVKAAFFDANRAHYFHYGLFVNMTNFNMRSGIGETFGSNFIVSLGGWHNKVGSLSEQTGTLMHELGHNLGLDHGGADAVNRKPNYLSVMSYEHQVVGIISLTSSGDVVRFDYSREQMPTLNELNLSDWTILSNSNDYTRWACPDHHTVHMGLVSQPIDWDCDQQLTTGVVNDVNNDTVEGLLTGYNDWVNLRYSFVQGSSFNIGCNSHCDIGCNSHCDIGCNSGCDIGCKTCGFGLGVEAEINFTTAQAIEASWAAFLASPHRPTTTNVSCVPSSVVVNTASLCTATVTDTGTGTAVTPTGTVSFQSSQPGSFSPLTCSLAPAGAMASCAVNYSPALTSLGSQTITSGYTGDANHLGSSGSTTVNGVFLPTLTITTNTTLANDVTSRIVIAANKVVLNCNGHTISGVTTDPLTGTYPGILSNGRNGVTIENCRVTNFYIGIQLVSSTNSLLSRNNAQGDGYGIILTTSNNNGLQSNSATNNLHDGFRLVSSNNTSVSGNTASSNLGSGFLSISSSNNALTLNTANGNSAYGFALTSFSKNNKIQGNSACTNGLFDAFQDTTSTQNAYKNNSFCTTQGLPSKS